MGLLHDIGKSSDAYQTYISSPVNAAGPKGPDHSTAGAREAVRAYGPIMGQLLAYGIAGHHAGLSDPTKLAERLNPTIRHIENYDGWKGEVSHLPTMQDLIACRIPRDHSSYPGFQYSFLTRMLFSCLVDADFLETERFYNQTEGLPAPARGGRIQPHHRDIIRGYMAQRRDISRPINALRSQILDHANEKAALKPGLFTLTVPTGGGKTLTSLSFALEHAIKHGLQRIIYVIPFTSIIEQTAKVFRDDIGLGDDVLEHHSNFDWDEISPSKEGDSEGEGREGRAKLRRDAENWDAPFVVTTAVQFFESLFSERTSRARKLHNLAGSVIILDEAQTMPVHLLRPCMAALDELARNYGASVVLCTATQPALRKIDQALPSKTSYKHGEEGFDIGESRELAPDPDELYRQLKRTQIEWLQENIPDSAIIERFAQCPQMLCIVNSRAHAQALFDGIKDQPGACHLTTLMYPRHRRAVLAKLRQDLESGQPVRLVHGGVDRNMETGSTTLKPERRPFTGAWIETAQVRRALANDGVAPSRGRGSKRYYAPVLALDTMSPLHGGVDRNRFALTGDLRATGRPFTGAWIENCIGPLILQIKLSTTQGKTRPRPLRRMVEAGTTSSRVDNDDRADLPANAMPRASWPLGK